MDSPPSQLCIYCLQNAATTDDHVPPKGVFAYPRPPDLLTVPACETCNKSFERDDMYFRDCLALDHRAASDPDAQRVVQAVLRGLSRSRGRGYSKYFLGRVGIAELRTATGLYLGKAGTYNVDLVRMGRVLSRIIRGLYFREARQPLPLDCRVEGLFPEGFAHLAPWELAEIQRTVIGPTLATPMRRIGRNVLRYWTTAASDREFTTAWVLQFYGGLRCAGVTLPPVS